MVTQIGHNIVHNINQEWNHSLLLITIEHHVQQMSQHLMKTNKISQFSTGQTFLLNLLWRRNVGAEYANQHVPVKIQQSHMIQ